MSVDNLDDYIRSHIDPEGDYLHRLYRDTQLRLSYGQMACGHIQGRLLKMFTRMVQPRLVVELGTFSGYSALCIAEGLEDGAVLHTFEIYDEQEDFTRPWIEGSAYADKIQLHIGDALQLIPQMDLKDIDLAFVDADKRHYVEFYEMLLPRVRKGGIIIADNTLWYGHVVEEHTRESDQQTLGIKAFNDLLANDDRVEKVIVPVRDGLTIIRKK
ncbi:MAG: class I SAM-dependent methyltransferase [Bacteroidaceae bacterium]|nr:class I SAM-dependent methyltransferase [Bacteroidaceae bacterium]